jgi:Transport protein Trs120 or TRAPPC9, TRAPP II complex subunit
VLLTDNHRIAIPIKKFLLSEDAISMTIPTLSDRQFVLTKSNLTLAEEKAQRELFWYREELFKCVRGRWQEVSVIPTRLYFRRESDLLDARQGGRYPFWRSIFTAAAADIANARDPTYRGCESRDVTGAIRLR